MTEEEKRFRRELESAVCPTFPNEHRIVDAAVEIHVAAAKTERDRCLAIIAEAFDNVPYLPMNRDHPRVDVPDLFELQQAIEQRIEEGQR